MSRLKQISIAAVATVALVGVLASPAGARVVNSPGDTATAKSSDAQNIVFRSHPVNSPASATPVVATVEVSDSSGFDWGAASIGAATTLAIGALMLAAVLLNRRRHRPVAHRTAAA